GTHSGCTKLVASIVVRPASASRWMNSALTSVDVLVRDHAYLKAVAEACPFSAAELEAKQLHVTYLSGPVTPERYAGIDPAAHLPEEFRLGDRALYLYAPDGLGRSKLAEALSRSRVNKGLIATTRNWNTALKLVELTG
ncbi:DUF1697 domain-containing protein, partial [Streptomyces sp. NPDC007162]|uniref:DUF1697 domain-containing protein n=1 Tax=Streptomyces sp. NPDC007162 TaxID=3156917 RepID=UPI0033DF1B45